jgi:hypothetical protein
MCSANTAKQWTPERRAAVAAKAKAQWASGTKRQVFSSEEYRTKKSEQMIERWKDLEYQSQMSSRVKEQWKDPTKRPRR